MSLTSIFGAWGVLWLSGSADGTAGEPAMRRFLMLAVGLSVGGFAYLMSIALLVEPMYLLVSSPRAVNHYPASLFDPDGTANLLGYLGYFGGFFVVPRWWRQTDPLRRTRLSVWTTSVIVLWSIVLFSFLPFPRGFMIAATISIAVQLAAPWVSIEERKVLRQRAVMEAL
jgi:hypothetical protein